MCTTLTPYKFFFGDPESRLAGADSLTTYLTCFVITSLSMYLYSVNGKKKKNGIEKDKIDSDRKEKKKCLDKIVTIEELNYLTDRCR